MFYLEKMHAVIALLTMVVIVFNYSHWELNDNELKNRNRKIFTLLNIILLILLNFLGVFLVKGSNYIPVLLFQIVLFVTLTVCHLAIKSRVKAHEKNYVNNYIRYLLILLFLIVVIPTLKFTESAYKTENEISFRHTQIDLMKQLENRNKALAGYYKKVELNKGIIDTIYRKRQYLGIYTDFLKTTIDTTNYPYNKVQPIPQNDYWDTLASYFRPFFNEYITENKYLIYNFQKDSAISWNSTDPNKITFEYISFSEKPNLNKLYRKRIVSNIKNIRFCFPFSGNKYSRTETIIANLIFWLLIAFIFYIFYLLVKFGARKIFCLDIVDNYSHQDLADSIRNLLLTKNDILITRLSSIDETEELKKTFLPDFEHIYIDWSDKKEITDTTDHINVRLKKINVNDADRNENPIIVFIDHFSCWFDDPEIFNEKLNIIQHFHERNDLQMILLSQNRVHEIIEYYTSLVEQKETKKEDREMWNQILHEFNKTITNLILINYPVNYKWSYRNEYECCSHLPVFSSNDKLIHDELNASDYLKQFIPSAEKFCNKYCSDADCKNPKERIVNHISTLAEKYYFDLLKNCSDEERYVLYDAADDLIINPNNSMAIISLLKKGLLIKECDKIKFMNISFRQFVLNSLNKAEIADIELKMGKENGSWHDYKITLIIIILGLFSFIAMANEDFINNLNELFVAIGGGIAVITGILGLLSKKSSTETQ